MMMYICKCHHVASGKRSISSNRITKRHQAFMFKQAVWISSCLKGFCSRCKKAALHHRRNMERVRGLQNKACAPGVALKDHAGDSLPWAMFGVQRGAHARAGCTKIGAVLRTALSLAGHGSPGRKLWCALSISQTRTHTSTLTKKREES